MDALLVFPYFLVKLFSRMGAELGFAVWMGAILSAICVVTVMMAPFHPRPLIKASMAGVSWAIIVLAAIGCVGECQDAQRAAEQRQPLLAKPQIETVPQRHVVNLGEA